MVNWEDAAEIISDLRRSESAYPEDDGQFECELHHVHDKYDYQNGINYEGAPCPNDPDSPNAYPEED